MYRTSPLRALVTGRAVIRDDLATALGDAGSAVVVTGDAGMGASTLLRTLPSALNRVLGIPVPTTVVSGIQGLSSVPYGALSLAFPSQSSEFADADAVTAAAIALAALTSGAAGTASSQRAVLIIIDAAHALDAQSAAALSLVIHSGQVRAALSLRSGCDLPAGLEDALRGRVARRRTLAALDDADSAELLNTELGAPLDPESSALLTTLGAGHPFFLSGLARSLLSSSAIRVGGSQAIWVDRSALPSTVAELVAADISRLDQDQTRVVHLVALGGALPERHLPGDVPDGVVDGLVRTGLLRRLAGPPNTEQPRAHTNTAGRPGPAVLVPAHPLIGEAVRARMSADAQLTSAELLVTGLTTDPDVPDTTVRAVVMTLIDHSRTAPIPLLMRALEHAIESNAHDHVLRIEAVLQSSRDNSDARLSESEEHRLVIERVTALRLLGDPAAARAARAAAWVAMDTATDEDTVSLAQLDSEVELCLGDDPRAAIRALDAVRYRLTTERGRALLSRSRVLQLSYAGYAADARAEYATLRDQPLSTTDRLPLTGAISLLRAQRGNAAGARRLCRDGIVHTSLSASHFAVLRSEIGMAWIFCEYLSGRRFTADWLYARGTAVAQRERSGPAQNENTVNLGTGIFHLYHGSWREAATHLERASAGFTRYDPHGFGAQSEAGLALALAALGNADGARDALGRSLRTPLRANRIIEGPIRHHRLLARLWLAEDNLAEDAEDLIQFGRDNDLGLIELFGIHCWFLNGTDDPSVRSALHTRAIELAAPMNAPVAAAILAHLDEMSGGTVTRTGAAARALARLGLIVPQTLSTGDLTAREREVGQAAALGYSSKAIANTLSLSRRTVDTHLGRVFQKLGVNDRDGLLLLIEQAGAQRTRGSDER
ncbi:MAG: LuxR C-terminal-related transcriptional regulator [Mycetocola sp.]